jgi:undecaprenyl-phosphate galactose phosphotransferase
MRVPHLTRPYLAEELSDLGESRHFISQVRPGLSGLWQAIGRNDLPFRDRVRLDENYIRNRSFWFDIIILCKTVRTLTLKRGGLLMAERSGMFS